jgi:hypothetical protein
MSLGVGVVTSSNRLAPKSYLASLARSIVIPTVVVVVVVASLALELDRARVARRASRALATVAPRSLDGRAIVARREPAPARASCERAVVASAARMYRRAPRRTRARRAVRAFDEWMDDVAAAAFG